MSDPDIRWIQRFSNYQKALGQLAKAVAIAKERGLTELEEQGLIQAFEFTHELAWNIIKDYFYYQGNDSIRGSRDAVKEAFQKKLIDDGDGWIEMIQSRNASSHTYDNETAKQIASKIIDQYFPLFVRFEDKMKSLL